ncbi:hypothetical protein SDJN03_29173, partial [Cucurbita argyrosperma subsp. sororia]
MAPKTRGGRQPRCTEEEVLAFKQERAPTVVVTRRLLDDIPLETRQPLSPEAWLLSLGQRGYSPRVLQNLLILMILRWFECFVPNLDDDNCFLALKAGGGGQRIALVPPGVRLDTLLPSDDNHDVTMVATAIFNALFVALLIRLGEGAQNSLRLIRSALKREPDPEQPCLLNSDSFS